MQNAERALLASVDIGRCLAAARQKGYEECELYAESSTRVSLRLFGKIEDVRFHETSGLSLRCFDGQKALHFSTTHVSTAGVLSCLRAEADVAAESAPVSRPGPESAFGELGEKVMVLSSLMRSLQTLSDEILHPTVGLEATVRRFEIAHGEGPITAGHEESAECQVQWAVARENGPARQFSRTRARASLDRLIESLKVSNPFLESARRSLHIQDSWPVPTGELPVLWSSRALAKLCLQFLRGFEGDRVLSSLSFLNDLALPVPFRFSVEEVTGAGSCDHEGSPRRPVTVFKDGRPRALAVNNRIAAQLAVRTTGHCRRESFRAVPTVGFWSARLVGHETAESLLPKMARGLSVRDLEVVKFRSETADLRLRLTEVSLVHHGEEGEAVAPFEVELNLLTILERLAAFSAAVETEGFRVAKGTQSFLTEITVPSALSEPLSVPGTVPASHYW